MSTHPNVILMACLTPDDLARKTYRDICESENIPVPNDSVKEIKIGEAEYAIMVMEEAYDESIQIQAKEGDIVVYELVTYGYGEVISWEKLERLKTDLEIWCKKVCEQFKCSYRIEVSANYW